MQLSDNLAATGSQDLRIAANQRGFRGPTVSVVFDLHTLQQIAQSEQVESEKSLRLVSCWHIQKQRGSLSDAGLIQF